MIKDTCSKLYDITTENCKSGGGEGLQFIKIALLNALDQQDKVANIEALKDLEGMDYAESVYTNLLYRPMDPASRERVNGLLGSMEADQFKNYVLKAVTNSQEFATRDMKLEDENGNVISASDSLKKRLFRSMHYYYLQIAKHMPWLKELGSKINRGITKRKLFK